MAAQPNKRGVTTWLDEADVRTLDRVAALVGLSRAALLARIIPIGVEAEERLWAEARGAELYPGVAQ